MLNFFKKILALLNAAEGFIHIAITVVGFWGIFATGEFDWRIVLATSVNLVLGLFSLLTGYVLVSKKFDFLRKLIGLLNTLEGVIHLTISAIGFWGIIANFIWDWRIWSVPVEHLVFGLLSLLTGYLIKHHYLEEEDGHHH